MKPSDLKLSTFIGSSKEINHKAIKFKISDIVRISKYKNIFPKRYVPNRSKEDFAKNLKTLCRGHMLLLILKVKKFWERFTKKSYKRKGLKLK